MFTITDSRGGSDWNDSYHFNQNRPFVIRDFSTCDLWGLFG